jgi:hypothetical protein
MRIRRVWFIGTAAILGVSFACGIDEFPTANVPDDSQFVLTFTCDKTAAPVAKQCDLVGRVILMTGDGAGAGWTVDVFANGGSFIPSSGDSVIRARRLTTGPAGEFTVKYRAPAEPAAVIFTVAASGITKLDTLTVVNADAGDDPPVAAIVLTPDSISVKKGDSVEVRATFLQVDKTELSGRLAYFSTDDRKKATTQPGPASKVWVKGIDTGSTTLFASRRAIHTVAKVQVVP